LAAWLVSILRRAAEFFQAFAAFVPGLGIEGADVAALVERQTGAGLAPEEYVLRGSLDGARRLPEPGGLVEASGEDALAVGAERGGNRLVLKLQWGADRSGNHGGVMLQRRAERLAGRAFPQARGVVCACGDDALAVGAERGGNHIVLMLQRRADWRAG